MSVLPIVRVKSKAMLSSRAWLEALSAKKTESTVRINFFFIRKV